MNIIPIVLLLMAAPMISANMALSDREDQASQTPFKAMLFNDPATTLKVRPGVHKTIPIAIGHLNRIILPFDHPEIRTINPATTELKGHVLYVAPMDDQAVTLFITEAEEEEDAISLTLIPESRPPQEVHLELQEPSSDQSKTSHETHRHEDPAPSFAKNPNPADPVKTIKKAFRAIALGQLPEGYRFRKPQAHEKITLQTSSRPIKLGQVLQGEGIEILIGVIKNSSKDTLEIHESDLHSPGLATVAAALWPRTKIAPGASSEIYLAVRPFHPPSRMQRPYLLSAQP